MADATVSDAEIEALRFHLGYGNVAIGGYPYTPEGFVQLFTQVIQPYLGTAQETTATTAITAGIATVTPASMTDIARNVRLVVDVGEDAEIVTVQATTATTFSARFAKDHASSGYPIAVDCGIARLRILLHKADAAHTALTSPNITRVAGLNSVGKGEVVWFAGNRVLRDTLAHYQAIVAELGKLVRVDPIDTGAGGRGGGRMEVY